jgi:hypothetical protein
MTTSATEQNKKYRPYHKRPIREQIADSARSINRLALKRMAETCDASTVNILKGIQSKAADILESIQGVTE